MKKSPGVRSNAESDKVIISVHKDNLMPIPENESLRCELEECRKNLEILRHKMVELTGTDFRLEEMVREQTQELESSATKLAKEILDRRRANAALRESERKFREIVQNIPGMVFQLRILPDGSNIFTYLSPRAHEIFGMGGDFTDPGWDISPFIHRDDRAGFFLSLAKASLADSWDYKGRMIGSNGELKWFHGIASTSRVDSEIIMDGLLIDITEQKLTENAQLFITGSEWTEAGEDFFQSLARYLARTLEMDYVCIDRLTDTGLSAQTVAIYFDGQFEDNVSYTLKDTPCGDVVGKAICCFREGVRHLFPKDVVLQEMIAESYVGTTLWSSAGKPIGLIAVIGKHPLADPQFAASMLKMVAIRAAGELERREANEKLRISLTKYQALFESFPHAVTLTDEKGNIVESNRKAEILLGIPMKKQVERTIDSQEWTLLRRDGTIMAPEEYASVRALKENCLVANVEMGIQKNNEKITWINVTALPIPVPGYGVVITYEEINDLFGFI
ncbi:MAG: PAS domain S-box protein [Bacteroidota bacterium]